MNSWIITQRNGWLRIDNGEDVGVAEARRIGEFGTVRGGFIVCTTAERMRFNCNPAEARRCIDQLWDLLAVV
jgi:hypothetical protein